MSLIILKKYKIIFFSLILILVAWLLPSWSYAQVDSTIVDQSNNHLANEMNFGKVLLRTIVSLVFVIVLLVVFVAGMKWLQNRTQSGYTKLKTMSIQETLTLGPKKQLFLVNVLGRILLIGASENNLSLIVEMSEEEKKKISVKKGGKQQSFSKTLANQVAKISGIQKS